jgi:hypothetical protein
MVLASKAGGVPGDEAGWGAAWITGRCSTGRELGYSCRSDVEKAAAGIHGPTLEDVARGIDEIQRPTGPGR